jgi:hypothetical protein
MFSKNTTDASEVPDWHGIIILSILHNSCKKITKAPFTNEEGFSKTVEYWKIFYEKVV